MSIDANITNSKHFLITKFAQVVIFPFKSSVCVFFFVSLFFQHSDYSLILHGTRYLFSCLPKLEECPNWCVNNLLSYHKNEVALFPLRGKFGFFPLHWSKIIAFVADAQRKRDKNPRCQKFLLGNLSIIHIAYHKYGYIHSHIPVHNM